MTPNIDIWQGSGSFYPNTFTPFGFYDNDPAFALDCESVAKWCALRIGFPIVDVELQEINFYASFEEAINEYGALLNTYQARDNMLNLQGNTTGSVNLSQTYVAPTLKGIFKLAKAYGSEVGAGGTLTYYSGSISVREGKQVYNFLTDANIESGSFVTDEFTIRKIYHQAKPVTANYANALGNANLILDNFGWVGYGSNYVVMPLYHDVLAIQHIEFTNEIRRSGYSFELTNNRLKLYPIPPTDTTLWFTYTLDNEDSALNGGTSNTGKITDLSNIPYQNITYRYINEIGKQWIRKYTLAIVKETLGYIRNKYSSIPIPDGEVTLNGDKLIEDGRADKEALITDLKETLDSMSYQSQLERKTAVAENLMNQLKYVPTKIYLR